MNKFETFVVILTVLVASATATFVGYSFGTKDRQKIIIEECNSTGFFIDRGVILACRVGTPRMNPGESV